jgi:hypothetical protein
MFTKAIRYVMAMIAILGVGYVAGVQTPTETPQVTPTAYETTPGPTGSGVLGDWSAQSHGLYCFQPGSTPDTAYTRATKAGNPVSSASMACQGEDARIYGDSITFGGKSALAAEFNALGYTLYVDAWSGRPTTPAVDALVAETVLPQWVIMAVGTNDIFNSSVMGAQVQRAENFIAAYNAEHGTNVQLFWVDVQCTRWKQSDVIQRNDQRNSMAVNLAIYKRIPIDHVVSIAGRFADNPSLLGTYLLDGTHYKAGAGYAYWAAFIRGWLQSFGGLKK